MSPTLIPARARDVMFEPVVQVNARTAWGRGIGIDESGGVTTYWIASRMGAIEWGEPMRRGMFWVGAQYAIALPALTITARRMDRGRGGTDHRPPRLAATPGAST